jgi:hypothetical protein
MSLESSRNRLREMAQAARVLATSAERAGTREPVVVQIGVRFYLADGPIGRREAGTSRSDLEIARGPR